MDDFLEDLKEVDWVLVVNMLNSGSQRANLRKLPVKVRGLIVIMFSLFI